MVSPMTIGSLKLGSAGLVCSCEITAEPWEGFRFGRKRDNCVESKRIARKKTDAPKAEFNRCAVVVHGRKSSWPGARLVRCDAESGKGGGETEINGVLDGMRNILASQQRDLANQAAIDLVCSLDPQGRAALLSALYHSRLGEDTEEHFKEADTNLDGIIDQKEFATYAEAQAIKYGNSSKPISTKQMLHLFTKAAVGMVGFGFTDNAIMIIAGDAIQNSIGATLGLTTLMSAGLGNAVADLIGTAFRGYIERLSENMMPQDIPISTYQMQQKEAWWADTVGATCGVTVGCLLGLSPLFLLHKKDDQQRHDAGIDTKFASISKSTTPCSSSSYMRLAATDDNFEYRERATEVTSLITTSVLAPAAIAPCQLRSFHSNLLGTPLLLLSMVAFMALRRVVNYKKVSAYSLKNRS